MDIEEPIQQLLKNTGWSCEDLLAKLQQYKSLKDTNKKDVLNTETASQDTSQSEECVVDSTKEINESDIAKVQNLEPKSNLDEISQKRREEVANLVASITQDFSDTDEEEVELNATNSSIINEIIDDISTTETSEETAEKSNTSYQPEVDKDEATEVTEVRVIEVNTDDDDDDCFEDIPYKVCSNTTKKIEYLETYPRKVPPPFTHSNPKQVEEIVTINDVDFEMTAISNKEANIKSPDKQFTQLKNDEQTKSDSPKASCSNIGETEVQQRSSDFNKLWTNNDADNSDKNVEDIRNNLKLQLNSLRTRKKSHFFQDLKTKIREVSEPKASFNTVKDTGVSPDKNVTPSNPVEFNSPEKNEEESISKIDTNNSVLCIEDQPCDDLYTQTNEFGLVILNVQGGIDLDAIDDVESLSCKTSVPENNLNEDSSNANDSIPESTQDFNDSNSFPLDDNTHTDQEDIDQEGVCDAIRKIIGKQRNLLLSNRNKKYEVNKNEETTGNPKHSTSSTGSQKFGKRINSFENTTCSAENSVSSFTTEDTNQTVCKNSPFVSNTLDEFLTENSKLNISYNVPKSGAEDGLTDSYHEESPLLLKKVVKVDQPEKPKKVQTIKAKTVAQKRKILEKQRLKELKKSRLETKHQNKITDKGNKKETTNDNGDKTENNKENKVIKENIVIKENKGKRDSFVIYNDKKIWVRGISPDTCIAKIKCNKLSPIKTEKCTNVNSEKQTLHRPSQKQRKLSLLDEMERRYKEQIKYRPGPLSKKASLQLSGQENWKTEMKLMPKLFLEIIPKIGEPIPLNLQNILPQNNGRLTGSQIEFALSVLKKKEANDKPKVFRFPLAYSNNQEYILVRKQKIWPQVCPTRKSHSEQKSDDNIVADVIDDLIKYIEIKEIAPTLIKEDEKVDYKTDNIILNDVQTKMPLISENVSSIFKKPQKKRSRIELELSRLSCKVVNVEVEESFSEESCNKAYCRLGCVCKSLRCDRNVTYHCQKLECMLDCTCPKEKPVVYDKLTLPAGTDILSTDTVNRIEDEAKKDLAKVEREFTQTVIHTNDKTIVVGLGGRNKTRRATKAPKKYCDYVESFEAAKPDPKVKEVAKGDSFQNCFVSLEKLNLSGIIPLCLTHNSYNCQCEGNSLFTTDYGVLQPIEEDPPPDPIVITEEKIEIKEKKKILSLTPKHKAQKARKRKLKEQKINNENEESQNESDISSSVDTVEELTVTMGRPVRNIKKPKLKDDFSYSDEVYFYNSDCARVRGAPKYLRTRKNPAITNKTRSMLHKDDFINNVTDADILRTKVSDTKQLLEVDLLKNQLVAERNRKMIAHSLRLESYDKSIHKRKQTLEVRNDENAAKQNFIQGLAIQRRKKTGLLTRKNTMIESVFDGEIIIDRRNMELLKKMGPRTVSEGYARLLPWKALTESFRNDTINIWCMVDQPSRLLVNKSDKLPPKNYVNIRQTNQTSEVILWILRNKLPSGYHEDNVSFILKQTKDNYEICGLCTKNFTEESDSNKAMDGEQIQTEKVTMPFRHKDLNGDQQVLYIQKEAFKLQELMEENLAEIGETSVDKNKLYMWAALPEIYKVCKWRMIFLNSDFTYLYFTTLKYSIKYTDLVSINDMAKAENCTMVLKNQQIESTYDHSLFGIYFDPHYQDRLFIGPYFKQFTGNDIETLRYINKSLVCTESFNKMQGKMDYKCGHWLIERPYGSSRRRPDMDQVTQSIDLTSDNEDNSDRKRKGDCDVNDEFKRSQFSVNNHGREHIVILHNDVRIKVIDGMPRKPQDFNRYIITNIPHFGYLGAYQHNISNELDVSWPFENKLLRFPTVGTATEFLQERFMSLLQPIPETFKINVIVLTSIDLENSHPINASILTGHYICGEFGCYNVKTITNEFCLDKLGTSREELLRVFAKRAQAFVRVKIDELAALLSIPKSQLGCYDIVNILDMAKKEINDQREIEKTNMSKKNDLLLQKRELALRIFNMISLLPEEQRQSENLKFRDILSNRIIPQTMITEPIEIPDSDEDEVSLGDDKDMPMLSDESKPEPPRSSLLGMPTLFTQSVSDSPSKSLLEKNPKDDHSTLIPESSMAQAERPLISILKDKSTSSKVAESATKFPRQRQLRLKSILKPKLPSTTLTSLVEPSATAVKEPISTTSKPEGVQSPLKNMPPPQFLPGVKIVKTNTGKLVLVSDKNSNRINVNNKGLGTKVIIKNNKIVSIKSVEIKKKSSELISILGKNVINTNLESSSSNNSNTEVLSTSSDQTNTENLKTDAKISESDIPNTDSGLDINNAASSEDVSKDCSLDTQITGEIDNPVVHSSSNVPNVVLTDSVSNHAVNDDNPEKCSLSNEISPSGTGNSDLCGNIEIKTGPHNNKSVSENLTVVNDEIISPLKDESSSPCSIEKNSCNTKNMTIFFQETDDGNSKTKDDFSDCGKNTGKTDNGDAGIKDGFSRYTDTIKTDFKTLSENTAISVGDETNTFKQCNLIKNYVEYRSSNYSDKSKNIIDVLKTTARKIDDSDNKSKNVINVLKIIAIKTDSGSDKTNLNNEGDRTLTYESNSVDDTEIIDVGDHGDTPEEKTSTANNESNFLEDIGEKSNEGDHTEDDLVNEIETITKEKEETVSKTNFENKNCEEINEIDNPVSLNATTEIDDSVAETKTSDSYNERGIENIKGKTNAENDKTKSDLHEGESITKENEDTASIADLGNDSSANDEASSKNTKMTDRNDVENIEEKSNIGDDKAKGDLGYEGGSITMRNQDIARTNLGNDTNCNDNDSSVEGKTSSGSAKIMENNDYSKKLNTESSGVCNEGDILANIEAKTNVEDDKGNVEDEGETTTMRNEDIARTNLGNDTNCNDNDSSVEDETSPGGAKITKSNDYSKKLSTESSGVCNERDILANIEGKTNVEDDKGDVEDEGESITIRNEDIARTNLGNDTIGNDSDGSVKDEASPESAKITENSDYSEKLETECSGLCTERNILVKIEEKTIVEDDKGEGESITTRNEDIARIDLGNDTIGNDNDGSVKDEASPESAKITESNDCSEKSETDSSGPCNERGILTNIQDKTNVEDDKGKGNIEDEGDSATLKNDDIARTNLSNNTNCNDNDSSVRDETSPGSAKITENNDYTENLETASSGHCNERGILANIEDKTNVGYEKGNIEDEGESITKGNKDTMQTNLGNYTCTTENTSTVDTSTTENSQYSEKLQTESSGSYNEKNILKDMEERTNYEDNKSKVDVKHKGESITTGKVDTASVALVQDETWPTDAGLITLSIGETSEHRNSQYNPHKIDTGLSNDLGKGSTTKLCNTNFDNNEVTSEKDETSPRVNVVSESTDLNNIVETLDSNQYSKSNAPNKAAEESSKRDDGTTERLNHSDNNPMNVRSDNDHDSLEKCENNAGKCENNVNIPYDVDHETESEVKPNDGTAETGFDIEGTSTTNNESLIKDNGKIAEIIDSFTKEAQTNVNQHNENNIPESLVDETIDKSDRSDNDHDSLEKCENNAGKCENSVNIPYDVDHETESEVKPNDGTTETGFDIEETSTTNNESLIKDNGKIAEVIDSFTKEAQTNVNQHNENNIPESLVDETIDKSDRSDNDHDSLEKSENNAGKCENSVNIPYDVDHETESEVKPNDGTAETGFDIEGTSTTNNESLIKDNGKIAEVIDSFTKQAQTNVNQHNENNISESLVGETIDKSDRSNVDFDKYTGKNNTNFKALDENNENTSMNHSMDNQTDSLGEDKMDKSIIREEDGDNVEKNMFDSDNDCAMKIKTSLSNAGEAESSITTAKSNPYVESNIPENMMVEPSIGVDLTKDNSGCVTDNNKDTIVNENLTAETSVCDISDTNNCSNREISGNHKDNISKVTDGQTENCNEQTDKVVEKSVDS